MRKYIKIQEKFNLKNATIFGGYNVFRDYLEDISLFRILEENISIRKAPLLTIYPFHEVLGFMIEGYSLGLERIYHFQSIENDPLLTKKNNMEKLPDYTLYQKDLLRIRDTTIDELKTVVHLLIEEDIRKNNVLDFDSTVETVYGDIEQTAVGYNPVKRGRKSYHPLFCSHRESGLAINFKLRPGNTNAQYDFELFFSETIDLLGKNKYFVSCLDSGFDSETVYNAHEIRGLGYVAKLKMFDKTKAISMRGKFKSIALEKEATEAAEIFISRDGWTKKRRAIVLRWKSHDDEPQGCFFDEFGYTYVAYVTNLDWGKEDIIRFYFARGGCENRIKEVKRGLFINKISSKHFLANYADSLLKIIAYNLILKFQKRLKIKEDGYFSAATFRRLCFYVPAVLVTTGRRLVLNIKKEFAYQNEWTALHHEFSSA